MLDPKTFSLAEMTSNTTGKTSGSGTMGIYLVVVGGLIGMVCSAWGLYTNSPQTSTILLYSSATLTLGAGLLGYRKSKDTTEKPKELQNTPG